MTKQETFSKNYQELIEDLRKQRSDSQATRDTIVKLQGLVIGNQPKEHDGSRLWSKESDDVLKSFAAYLLALTSKNSDHKKIDERFKAIESTPVLTSHVEI